MSIIQNKEELVTEMLKSIKSTEAFSAADLAWCELILRRNDGQNGAEQLRPLVARCEDFLDKKEELERKSKETGRSPKMRLDLEKISLHQSLFSAKSLYYKQKKILLGVAQRKRHPQHVAPNLGGFIAPQAYRVEVETVYGKGYAESREYLAEKAIETNCTHILFVDDDILLPLDALDRLISANEMFVAANYYKRNPLLESVVTAPGEDKQVGYHNIIVEAKKGDYGPVPVNAAGLGAALINVDLFKMMPKPWFEFVWETLPNGQKGRLLIGEDSHFLQKMLMGGLTPKVIPGLCALHVDFATGKHYGPEWLVDPIKRKVLPEFEEKFCKFSCDTKELVAEDVDTVFKGPK
jgi:hypothetical protein